MSRVDVNTHQVRQAVPRNMEDKSDPVDSLESTVHVSMSDIGRRDICLGMVRVGELGVSESLSFILTRDPLNSFMSCYS